MGNEIKKERYWDSDEKILCRVCGREKETLKHVWERCTGGREEEGS